MTRRERYEAQLRRRATIKAAISTVAVVLAIVIVVPMAPGWEAVKGSFFDTQILVLALARILTWTDISGSTTTRCAL